MIWYDVMYIDIDIYIYRIRYNKWVYIYIQWLRKNNPYQSWMTMMRMQSWQSGNPMRFWEFIMMLLVMTGCQGEVRIGLGTSLSQAFLTSKWVKWKKEFACVKFWGQTLSLSPRPTVGLQLQPWCSTTCKLKLLRILKQSRKRESLVASHPVMLY